jgi:hypothetical protein
MIEGVVLDDCRLLPANKRFGFGPGGYGSKQSAICGRPRSAIFAHLLTAGDALDFAVHIDVMA